MSVAWRRRSSVPAPRPVLAIRDNRVTTEFLGPDSDTWTARIDGARSDPGLRGSGHRPRRAQEQSRLQSGSAPAGWLPTTSSSRIVTWRASSRAGRSRGVRLPRRASTADSQSAHVDFLEEFERAASLEFAIESILWIATPNEPDVAFLRVRAPDRPTGAGGADPARRDRVAPDDFVVTIGYPARDPRVPDQRLVQRIFGDVYEKKRLAPGQVTDVGPDELQHDCSTLGGNSGSPVINLKTGEAVGLHFSGLFLEANFAVPAPKVRELLGKVQRAELPGMGPIEVRTRWQRNWRRSGRAARIRPSTTPGTLHVSVSDSRRDHGEGRRRPSWPAAAAAIGRRSLAAGRAGGRSGFDRSRGRRRRAPALAGRADVIDVRAGYRFKRGWITDERVVVVEVRKKLSPTELRRAAASRHAPADPRHRRRCAHGLRCPTSSSTSGSISRRSRPRRSRRIPRAADLPLDPVGSAMRAIFHISPDSGFPNLRDFLGRVRERLTATMYEWEADHISDAIARAITSGTAAS